jgi:hypothetical protein
MAPAMMAAVTRWNRVSLSSSARVGIVPGAPASMNAWMPA